MSKLQDWQKKAALVRKWSLVSTSQAGSGHPTSCLSAADITTVLFDKFFSFDIKNPLNPFNDRMIFSKGHAAPLLYTLFALSGAFPPSELLNLRKFKNKLEGHPSSNFEYSLGIATGSLGQGLSVGAGIALAQVKSSKLKVQSLPKVFVLLGDGECAEGNVWEACNFASYYKLNNLTAIVDINRFGQSQETMFAHHVKEYMERFSAFGFETIAIDGHNFLEIEKALKLATNNKSKKPFAIIARTKKGKGVSFIEDKDNWHGKPLKKEDLEKALKELGEVDENLRFTLSLPQEDRKQKTEDRLQRDRHNGNKQSSFISSLKIGDQIATREVYGKVLAELGKTNKNIFALDGDTKNSTFSMDFKSVHPDRFIECFIAEQNMVVVALGLSKIGKIPFASTFAAFLTRALDQIRMAGISKANVKIVGSHAGVSIGEDGPSQMGLENLAFFGTIPDSIIFQPCDAVSAARIIPLVLNHFGISYLQTLRPKTPVIYSNKEKFKVGGSKVLKKSDNDFLTVVATGITVFEALKAYEELKKEKIMIRVVDCYSLKPIDKETLIESMESTKKRVLVTVEDHYVHGGLGDFVLSALAKEQPYVEKMAVEQISCSGTKDELLDDAGISARHIVKKVKSMIGFRIKRVKKVPKFPFELDSLEIN